MPNPIVIFIKVSYYNQDNLLIRNLKMVLPLKCIKKCVKEIKKCLIKKSEI